MFKFLADTMMSILRVNLKCTSIRKEAILFISNSQIKKKNWGFVFKIDCSRLFDACFTCFLYS